MTLNYRQGLISMNLFLDEDLTANMPNEVTIDGRREELTKHENILRTVEKLKVLWRCANCF